MRRLLRWQDTPPCSTKRCSAELLLTSGCPPPLAAAPPSIAHHVANPCRINSIYQPAFVAGGGAVAASCERSPRLSLYCVQTGAAISRGSIDAAVGATACGTERGAPLLCTGARTVVLYQPTWEAA